MIALFVGTLLAVAALGFVLLPLFTDAGAERRAPGPRPGAAAPPDVDAVAALREIEFDRATGKLSDADYAALKSAYTRLALASLRAAPAEAPPHADAAELAVLAYRARRSECPSHGPRPEADAIYCSECGRYLKGPCAHCGAAVTEAGARFCSACGHALAA